jgi:hypothetical protein
MMHKRLLVVTSASVLLAGCASGNGGGRYVPVVVSSSTASEFYYTRADTFERAGPTEAVRRAEMAKANGFGPFSLPATMRFLEGMAYLVVPRCRDAIAWNRAVWQPVSLGTRIVLECSDGP